MDWLTLFQWCEDSMLGTAIRESSWAFPVIEAVHLVAFSILGGAVVIVDLRLLGLGLRQQSAASLAKNVQPWLLGSLVTMIVTGTLLFFSEATKCYYSTPFWVKMSALALAILFMLTVRRVTLKRLQTQAGLWNL